jgi:hypothetical protein
MNKVREDHHGRPMVRRGPAPRGRAFPTALLMAGLALVALAVNLRPGALPLYDGVVVIEPYRFLHPLAGQAGNPTAASLRLPLAGGPAPPIDAGTAESPPQAQLVIGPGALVLPAGSSTLTVSIRAVDPPSAPGSGRIEGNVYAFTLSTDGGNPVTLGAGQVASIVLRAPLGAPTATIERYVAGVWRALATTAAGLPDTYVSNTDALGELALVSGSHAPGETILAPSGPATSQLPPTPSPASAGPPTTSASSVGASSSSARPTTGPGTAAGGPPIALIAGLVALTLIGALALLASARRRPPPRSGRLGG